MKIGVPIEIKKHEYRVGLAPHHAAAYVKAGHEVYIQHDAGVGSGYSDEAYTAVGCKILPTIEDVYAKADMIIKVKEPIEHGTKPEYDGVSEYKLMREGQILYTYFHLAADKALTKACVEKKIIAIAYETIRDRKGALPCLKPMSEIAGRLSVQEGAKYLEKPFGGRGVLLGGVTGVLPANVLVLGGAGVVGRNAVAMAVGLGANVTAVDVNLDALTEMDTHYAGRVHTLYSTDEAVREEIAKADLVIGAALIPGAATPQLIRKEHLPLMKKGAVIVDVAIDQGGTCQTSHVTYHDNPVFEEQGVIHYCVGNMPGAVPCTSTLALNNATLKYGLAIANKGYKEALKADPGLMLGLNAHLGKLTCKPVADFHGMEYTDPNTLF
ncbi:MAG: alanine dehydrogenase [Clostridiales bacterium]|nr:alanine dehydrogenase [Clostridiales bacterium]